MIPRLLTISLLLFISITEVSGQGLPEREMILLSDSTVTDSLTILPASVALSDSSKDIKIYFHSNGKSITFNGVTSPLTVRYAVLPFDLGKPYHHRSLSVYDSQALFKDPPGMAEENSSGWLGNSNISRQGAITRGITIGSNQSMTMQSRLNLQLEGKLNDDLNVIAQITDQQMPYLPEGNSQYMRDFDNVSVRLFNDKFSLEAGNQLWKSSNSFFGRYTRNVEGVRLHHYKATGNGTSATYGGAASARGKFSRQVLPVEDGITGPYRIPRPGASSHVIILPGTERIYLDGQLLLRGYENDYTIDYNQGEVTFTNKVIITRYSRVIIEFEYTQLSYQQGSVMAGHEFKSEKYSYFIDYFRQHDNARQPLGIDLTSKDLEMISLYDPSGSLILLPGADSTGYNKASLMYARKDTITAEGKYYQLYYASDDPEEAHFRLSFRESEIGNYIIREYTAQGKVYQWVAPHNGIPQGNYEPVIALNAPETHQLLSVGGEYQLNEFDKINVEYSTSVFEKNNLSAAGPLKGGAALLGFKGTNRPVGFLDQYNFSHYLGLQWVQQDFSALERYRSVEFDRLWMAPDSVTGDDLLVTGSLELKKSTDQLLSYAFSMRDRSGNSGLLHQMDLKQRYKNIFATADLEYVRSGYASMLSEWKNYDVDLYYRAGSWQPGVRVIAENNSIFFSDSLVASANNFRERQIYLHQETESKGALRLLYSVREDYHPFQGEFRELSRANTFTASAQYEKLDLRMNYRKLDLDQQDNEEMLSGDVQWRTTLLGLLRQEIGYGLSQGRELSRAFQFVQVVPGEGTHTWRDMDNDGVQDIDEFFEAINIDERNFIKILIPTEDFVPAYEARLSYRGDIHSPQHWNSKEGILKLLSRLRGNINYQSTQKTSSNGWSERLLVFREGMLDSLLISERTMFRTKLFLNRTREKLGGAIGYNQTDRKQLFQVGFQEISRKRWTGDIMYSLNMFLDVNINGALAEDKLENAFSHTGNYTVKGYMLNQELVYTLNQQWRISGGYRWQDRHSVDFAEGKASHNEIKFNIKHSRKETFLTVDLRIIDIDFNGEENTATGYALLEAMRPGQNFYWQLNVQQKISGALRLSVFYDGRKSEDNNPVHLGRVQLTALF